METKYVCTGSCGGEVTEEEYQHGATICQTENCERKGQSLQKRIFCPKCNSYFKEKEEHNC